jgi:IS30 family transposase
MTKTTLRNELKEQARYLSSIRWSVRAIAYELDKSERTIKRWLGSA